MRLNNNQLGLKLWSNNFNYIEQAQTIFDDGIFGYIELYVVPETYYEYSSKWKMINVPIIIHATHDYHGFNLCEECLDFQVKLFGESQKYADLLDSKYIIFHPGHGNKDNANLNLFIKKINDDRMCIENMPALALDGVTMCQLSRPHEVKVILDEYKIHFCLDIGHAISAANYWQLDYLNEISNYLPLKPEIIHLSDGMKESSIDQHLHIGEGNYSFSIIIPLLQKSDVQYYSLETPKDMENDLNDFIIDCEKIIKF